VKHYELVKKWRLDEFEHRTTRAKIGIYVSQEGTFYARVPEHANGELVTAKTKQELTLLIQGTADRVLCLEWKKVIAVTMEAPNVNSHITRRSSSWGSGKWNPDDPATAGSNIRLSFIRYEVATQPDGRRCERDWPEYDGETRQVDVRQFFPVPGENVELPYTDELWGSLGDFQQRLAEMSHMIRTLISRDDVVPLLLRASGQRLLPMEEPK